MKKLLFAFVLTLGVSSFSSLNAETPVEEKPDWVILFDADGIHVLDNDCDGTLTIMVEMPDGSVNTENFGDGKC